jgi:hypothetical protein
VSEIQHDGKFSIAYSALGRQHVREAAISSWSAKRHMQGIPITIVTNVPAECPHFDRVLPVETRMSTDLVRAAKYNKVTAILAAPTDCVLYADADTYFLDDVSEVWSSTPPFDIAAAYDTWQFPEIYRQINNGLPYQDPSPACPYFNCGVLFIRKSAAVRRFLEKWATDTLEDDRLNRDQLLFREYIYASGLRIHVLPTIYNARLVEPIHLSGAIKIAHAYSGVESDCWTKSTPFIADFLNSTIHNRIYSPHDGRLTSIEYMIGVKERHLSEHQATREREEFLYPKLKFPPSTI